ncbi:DUF4167 domain-containing protein [Candidatus Odyssella acanthamoebae]|uniref:DUF4167 domain-containing protein n=1 Tax=Candidatus Odyssella acanthamoebae TaxID=91604 RepID=UPI00068AE8B1|nr:DUF4167 domain-containing protein [Candidatus Paracaedibacter acanthamoebae]
MLRRNRSRGSTVRRSNNNGGRPTSDRNVYERPESRPRYGVAAQNYERYLSQAKEALGFGDRVQAEYYYQHADHFLRILNEYREHREHQQANQSHSSMPSQGGEEAVAEGNSVPEFALVEGNAPLPESQPPVETAKVPPRRPGRRPRPKTEDGIVQEKSAAE